MRRARRSRASCIAATGAVDPGVSLDRARGIMSHEEEPDRTNDYTRVVIEQRGEMRLKPDGGWLPFTAEQWFAVTEVAFCWHARVKMAPFVTAVVDDAFDGGHGRLDARLWGALPIAHGEGPELDRGEAQRYLAELPWNPDALRRNPALQVQEVHPGLLKVWAFDPQTYVDLHLGPGGEIVRASCTNRPYGETGPRAWEGEFRDYQELGGLRVPTRAEVSWLLPEGRYTYWRGEVTDLRQE